MKYACKCLNIEITSLNNGMGTIDPSVRKLFEDGRIFEEDLVTIEVIHVVLKLRTLVEESITSIWQMYRCINCGMWAYACTKQIGPNNALINKQLLSDSSVMEKLRQSDKYSPVFKIIINNSVPKEPIDTESQDYLHPIAINWIKEQSLQTEERIKEFCDREYSNLEKLKLRVHKDQLAINRLLSEVNANKTSKVKGNSETTREISRSTSVKSMRNTKRSSSHYDSERIFDLEEFDSYGKDTTDDSNSEGSDVEENVEDTSSNRRYTNPSIIARSLPIPVPKFMEDRKGDKNRSPHGPAESSALAPSDIAASIKALAKSIHGDAIFGELPRPRFSTNL
ncbi:uncharacterized protein LOC106669992 [Cimex lectularius]|uniref:Uncharacterized protein n=1 Tax=Cimex lectularius TaxID=79782 RepID=A0A8I6SHT2_CIMLE|nr:uncharacterized protein LOC106669992 [Cimex lectularius]